MLRDREEAPPGRRRPANAAGRTAAPGRQPRSPALRRSTAPRGGRVSQPKRPLGPTASRATRAHACSSTSARLARKCACTQHCRPRKRRPASQPWPVPSPRRRYHRSASCMRSGVRTALGSVGMADVFFFFFFFFFFFCFVSLFFSAHLFASAHAVKQGCLRGLEGSPGH